MIVLTDSPETGDHTMRTPSAPDHTDPKALAGLRRRLILRTQRAIDTARAEGRWHDAERLAADHLRQRQARSARDQAAAVAGLPMGERISGDWERFTDSDGEVWGVILTGTI